MAESLSMRLGLLWFALALVLNPGVARAQRRIGEVRVVAIGAWAPAPHLVSPVDPLGPVETRYLGGGGLSLTFISGRLSAGPEVILLRGSDRRVYELGAVGRIGFGHRLVRPFILAGAGEYLWSRRFVTPPPPDFTGPTSGPVWDTDRNYLTGSIGGGVLVRTPLSRVSLIAELRLHASFRGEVGAGSRNLVTTSVGGRIAW
jgi:hypothetical protein